MLLTPNKEGIEPRVPSGSNLKTSLQKCYGRHHDLVNLKEHLCQKRPRICPVCRNHSQKRPRICPVCRNHNQKRPRICPVCRNHNPVVSSFMTLHRICSKSNTTDSTSEAVTAYPSGEQEIFKSGS